MSTPDPLQLVGTTIADKYLIEQVVGVGGFAIVYKAQHKIWQRPVAIKVFRALVDISPDKREALLQQFIQEGFLLADLSERSAAICQARDLGTLNTVSGDWMPYMVLEWLEGQSLEQVIEADITAGRPPRTLEQAINLLEPAAEALALAHKKGIAHRDVKPANIFVLGDPHGTDFRVKMLDFGIAKVVQEAQSAEGFHKKTQGVTSFTPAYASPEQFSRELGATGPWTDVFAMALIITELCTHRPPLGGDDLVQLAFSATMLNKRPTPRAFNVAIPDAVENVLLKALAVQPGDRYQSMLEFWGDLRAAMHMTPLALSATVPRASVAPAAIVASVVPPKTATLKAPTGLRPGNILAIALVMVLVVVGGSLAWLKKPAPPPEPVREVVQLAVTTTVPDAGPCPVGMVQVPGGKFFMGSDDKKDFDFEKPAHNVTLSPFCIDQYEVTTKKYLECSQSGACRRASTENDWEGITPAEKKIFDPLCNIREVGARGEHPINCIEWKQASEYCLANDARLPTEAEWEYATRGSDGRRYPWGDTWPTAEHLNACGTECLEWGKQNGNHMEAMYKASDGFPTTAPVGSFPKGKSPFGVEDVVGNVWEWVADNYAPYTAEAEENPTGPREGKERVIRGGAWNGSMESWVRPTFRFHAAPTQKSYGIGFRCAKSI